MNTELIQATAQATAQWWGDRLEQGDKELFTRRLSELVQTNLEANGECELECDYDPEGHLLEAIRYAGVNCDGAFFSTDGVLPRKHFTLVTPGLIDPKEGYGNWTEPIKITENLRDAPRL